MPEFLRFHTAVLFSADSDSRYFSLVEIGEQRSLRLPEFIE